MKDIFARRSIRKYTDKPVTHEEIKELLKAAFAAPSSDNNQEWVFIVTKDREAMMKIREKNEYAIALETAPVAILVCADMRKVGLPDMNYWVQDLSAASENMLIKATSMGLGSLWMGVHPDKEQVANTKEVFELPDYIEPMSLLTFGEPTRWKDPIDRYLEDRVHFEKYSEK